MQNFNKNGFLFLMNALFVLKFVLQQLSQTKQFDSLI